jgi:Synergist-CTERM protein sorting domain-containing protein
VLQADAFEQMAYSIESGIWRNYFLTGAWRNRSDEVRKFLDSDGGNVVGSNSGGCDGGFGVWALFLISALVAARKGKK